MSWEFYRHMPVYSASGDRVGRTEEIGHAVDFIHVQAGHWLVRDWYIPLEAVAGVGPLGVRLTVEPDEFRRRGWNIPPAQFLLHQGATPGYEYTSRRDIPPYAASDLPKAQATGS